MVGQITAVLGLAMVCGAWVVLQRWIGRVDPGAPGVEGRCGGCASHECPDDETASER